MSLDEALAPRIRSDDFVYDVTEWLIKQRFHFHNRFEFDLDNLQIVLNVIKILSQ